MNAIISLKEKLKIRQWHPVKGRNFKFQCNDFVADMLYHGWGRTEVVGGYSILLKDKTTHLKFEVTRDNRVEAMIGISMRSQVQKTQFKILQNTGRNFLIQKKEQSFFLHERRFRFSWFLCNFKLPYFHLPISIFYCNLLGLRLPSAKRNNI